MSNMSREETILRNELQKLVKQVNQRLVRLEQFTGKKGTFASKQLYDYLDTNTLNAITKTGRVTLNKNYTIQQLENLKVALEQFKSSGASTVKEIRDITRKYISQAGKPLSIEHINTLYNVSNTYTWIYDYIPQSDFWDTYGNPCRIYKWSLNRWMDELNDKLESLKVTIDEDMLQDLESLYYYCRG